MRAPIIALSLVGAVAIFLLGGFLNAITGIGFDVASPYNDPFRVVATFFGAAPGFVIALTGLGFALYDAARRNGLGWFITLLAWPFIPLLAASLMFAGALAYPESWFLLLALVPLAPLLYGITAPAAVTASPGTARVTASVAPAAPPATPTLNTPEMSAPATLPPSPTLPPPPAPRILSPSGMSLAASWRRLAVFVGVLAAVVVGGTLVLFPSLPASTGGQSGPPALQVTQASASADCASGTYPPVTLTNTGSQTL